MKHSAYLKILCFVAKSKAAANIGIAASVAGLKLRLIASLYFCSDEFQFGFLLLTSTSYVSRQQRFRAGRATNSPSILKQFRYATERSNNLTN